MKESLKCTKINIVGSGERLCINNKIDLTLIISVKSHVLSVLVLI